jgi:NAD(P)-dependent dehydrogenase (short-subunit alcohol dehydrogenase family)
MNRLDGKVAVVSGAASGIGRAVAVRFAAEGARVGLMDLDADGLAETEAAVAAVSGEGSRPGEPGAAISVAGDVVDPATVDALVNRLVAAHGRVDTLVNNVGILILKSLEETTAEDFDRLLRVNCLSHLVAMQRVVPEMRKAGGGSIINVASVGALVALPNVSAYCASKSAVVGLTRSAAYEFGPDIRCNAVCPGGVDTPMARRHLASFDDKDAAIAKLTGRQLLHRYAQPDEIANAILFLASDEASFMTGAVVPVEAGHSSW